MKFIQMITSNGELKYILGISKKSTDIKGVVVYNNTTCYISKLEYEYLKQGGFYCKPYFIITPVRIFY